MSVPKCTDSQTDARPEHKARHTQGRKPGRTQNRKSAAHTSDLPQARPFLKWVGGKSQLLPELRKYYPFATAHTRTKKPHTKTHITRYVEPFAGGGAVLFDILNHCEPEYVYLSDRNADLVNAYCCLRDQPEALIARLAALQEEYLPLGAAERKACYLAHRARFNAMKLQQQGKQPELQAAEQAVTQTVQQTAGSTDCTTLTSAAQLERAALLIFLNKTCFNGLYRVNRKGLFNVPAGVSASPAICNAENLRLVSARLQKVSIACADYTACADHVDEHTFVYFDPPYRPISPSSAFTAYTEESFAEQEQKALAAFFAMLHQRGALLLLSNSDPGNVCEDDFFDRLYAGFTIRRVAARRMINCKAAGRGEIRELLISNFAPSE